MRKLLKRSLSVVLAVMMVVTMFAGSFAVADATQVVWRSMDRIAGCSGSPDRPEPTLETNNYMEGAGAFNYNLSGRTKTDLFWYADEASSALEATTDITAAIDADGKTVWAFDLYVTDAESFMGTGNIFSIQCYAASDESKDVNNMNAWMEVNTASGGNATWTEDFGLENGLQDGWNHIAITFDTDDGENKYAHASNTRANYWDAAKLWKFRIVSETATAPAAQTMIIDDVRFMTPEYYASATYASEIKAKNVMALISAIEGKDDTEGMAAAKAAYDALTDEEKAMVLNYSKFESLTAEPMSVQLHACDSSANTIMAAGFSKWVKTSLNRTEGKYSMRGTAPEATVSIHFSFQSTDGWDFSKAEYLVFDFYYTGLSFNWVNGVNDQNIGLGPSTTWHDMGYGNITNAAMQTHMMSKLQSDKWNHVVIPLSAFNLTSEQLVHNLRFYWEGCVVAPSGTNQIWIDDIRIVNANGLETLVPEANAGKDLAQVIAGLTVDNTEGIAAAKASYDALSDTAKASVYNAATLDELEAAPTTAAAFDANVAAFAQDNQITYADKAGVEALRAEYDALSKTAKTLVTKLADLEAMEAVIAAEAEKAAAVVSAIEALPTEIDLSHKGVVEAARTSYDALADDTKAGVTNVAVLEAAEAKIVELETAAGDAEKAAAVDSAIEALKAADAITVDDETAINAAQAMFDALNDDQKALVKAENLAKLEAVKAALAQDKADREAAAGVDAIIAALPETVALTDKDAVYAARDAYTALNDKAKSYVTKLDVLVAAEETIAKMEKDIADAKAVEEQIAALPENITAADADAVTAARAAYRALSPEAKGLVPNLTTLEAAEYVIITLYPYDTPFRAFETALSDLAQDNGGAVGGLTKDDALVGSRSFQIKWDGSNSSVGMFAYVYAFNQNTEDDDELNNPDGCSKLVVVDPEDLYVTFDLYVSDASVLKNATGDCGFSLDTMQTGGANAWGNAGNTKAEIVRPVLQNLVDGWNHVVIPLTLSGAYIEEDGSKRAIKSGDILTVADIRLYCLGLTIPAEGFVVRIDDMRFMDGAGVAEINSLRNIAKDVTLAIRNYPAEPTYHDFYAIYAKYIALPEEYQTITKGWADFAAANEAFATQAAEQFPADKAAAAAVDAMIAPFAEGVTLDDKAAVEAARAAYDKLTDIQKNMVLKVEILIAAEQSIAQQEEDRANKEAAAAVDALINALPTAEDMTIDDKADVEAARAAYTALTDTQKKLVKGLIALREAETAIAQIEGLIAAAQPVVDMITALPGTITVDHTSVVEAARDAYDNLDEEVQEYVTNLAVLEAAEKALKEAITAADNKAAAAAVDALINALETPTDVTADDKEAIEAAKAAFDGLTEDQKAFLGEGATEKLAACVAALEKALAVKMGDVNNDGKIDAKDALIVLKISVGKYTANDVEKTAADVNQDQKIDAKDALEILKYAVKKPSALDKYYQQA